MVHRLAASLLLIIAYQASYSQEISYDSLKASIMALDQKVEDVNLNLETSQKKFKSSILIATIGYTTTIAGGLMLGRSNDQAGQALLIAGGVTGLVGTYKMVDAFSYLTGKKKKKNRKNH